MSDQEIDISQVLPGPCCGRYVPEPDEIERILAEVGIERTDQHPEFTQEPEEGFEYEGAEFESIVLLLGMGHPLEPPRWPPHDALAYRGAAQRWSEREDRQVRRLGVKEQ